MNKLWLCLSGVYGFSAVALGAFAAHALQAKVSERALNAIETGAHYALIHAVALLVIAVAADKLGRMGQIAGSAFALGILFFAGSLWFFGLTEFTGHLWVTPIGGVLLLLGWLSLLMAGLRSAT